MFSALPLAGGFPLRQGHRNRPLAMRSRSPMSSSPDSSPAGPAGLQTDHQCQNGCGNLADTVLVNLTDSSVDIQCHTCLMMMMVAAFRQLAEQAAEDEPATVDATT